MKLGDAVEMIRPVVDGRDGAWADLGAGGGTFTRALRELLGPGSRIYAVDRDVSAVAALGRRTTPDAIHVTPVAADFTRPFQLPGIDGEHLEGLLFANSLHFVDDSIATLRRLARWLAPRGRVVVVEYDQRGPSRWVPYPIPAARWSELATAAGLVNALVVGRRPSAFAGELYVGVADREGVMGSDQAARS